jgi:hypothetical protein
VESSRETDEFRRIELVAQIDRAEGLIATYREHIAIYRRRIDVYHHLLGRIGERLGEAEPKEPR